MKTIHKCKCHGRQYTVCPLCDCEYCPDYWPMCPRSSWHWKHATSDIELAKRAREMDEARRLSETRTA